MKHKVSELEGDLLDAAVAMAEGYEVVLANEAAYGVRFAARGGSRGRPYFVIDHYSTVWNDGGPIIDREQIGVWSERYDDSWMAAFNVEVGPNWNAEHQSFGPTPLIAAMRAFVTSRYGEEVELP
jgi:hypothetical protein